VGVLVDVVSAAAASTSAVVDHATSTLVTSDLHVRYLGRARGEHVRAEARVVKAGRSLVVIDTEVVDSEGTLVATADVAMSIVPHRA
jgi:acyl-CoA thioesterase